MMLNRIRNIRKDELIKGSFILFAMLGIYNVFNYVFQISMARLLGPADYGILAVLMSIIYIFAIPSEAIQNFITKYTSIFNVHNKLGKTKDLMFRSLKKSALLSLVMFILFIPLSLFLSDFLKIDIWLVLLIGLFIFTVFIMPVMRGIIQGRKKFSSLGLNFVLESICKVILSILLVLLGWKVYGAMTAVLLASVFAFVISLVPLKEIIHSKRERGEFNNIYKTNLPLIIATISIVLMYSIDIILARRFFSPEIAGQFAFVSLIGKVIIFVSSSIGKTMFPLSAEEFEKGNKTSKLLKKSLILVSIMAAISLILYSIFPKEIVFIVSLGSSQYLETAHILFTLGLSYSLISIANVIVLYKLSTNRIRKSAYFLLSFAILEVILLSLFNSNIVEFSISLLFSSLLIFLYSLLLLKK